MPEIKVNESLLTHAAELSEAAEKLTDGLMPLEQGRQRNRPATETIETTERFLKTLTALSKAAAADMQRIRELYEAFQKQDEEISGSFGGK